MTPAVVSSTRGVSLADHLKLSELPLAITPGGKNFTLKALHPSEHTIRSARVPGGNKPSVALCSDMIQTIAIPVANSTLAIHLTPNILAPASTVLYDGNTNTYANFYNPAFGGSYKVNPTAGDSLTILQQMYPKIAQYRITSQSVTVELIAPSLSDQGTITAAQYDFNPMTCQLSQGSGTNAYMFRPDYYLYPMPKAPSEILLGTTAYTSKAREGVYMPLKLTKFKYQDMHDLVLMATAPSSSFFDSAVRWGSESVNDPLTFPYYEDRNLLQQIQEVPLAPKMCGSQCGVIYVEGMAANVAVRVRVRQVVEIVAPPSTTYAPLLEAPIPPDELSVKMYFEISGRMKDAYPASYNDLGTLLKTIHSIGKEVLPYIDPLLEVVGDSGIPYASTIAKGIKKGKDIVTDVVKKAKKSKKAAKAANPAVPASKPQVKVVDLGEVGKKK